MKEYLKKSAGKRKAGSSLSHFSSLKGDNCTKTHGDEELQQTSFDSEPRTAASSGTSRQYQRRRVVDTAISHHDSTLGRLGIASNLL